MEMTTWEICKSYDNAISPKKQVGILADRNLCKKKDIVKILYENGRFSKEQTGAYIKAGMLSKTDITKKNVKKIDEKVENIDKKIEVSNEKPKEEISFYVPETVKECLFEYVAKLAKEKIILEGKIAEIKSFLEKVEKEEEKKCSGASN